jgi:hypothetical protein
MLVEVSKINATVGNRLERALSQCPVASELKDSGANEIGQLEKVRDVSLFSFFFVCFAFCLI